MLTFAIQRHYPVHYPHLQPYRLFDDELYVGHKTSSLTPERTLRNMYINPLLKILERQNPQTRLHPYMNFPRNGVFDTDPSRTLVLLIDFKTDCTATWPQYLNNSPRCVRVATSPTLMEPLSSMARSRSSAVETLRSTPFKFHLSRHLIRRTFR